MEDSYIDIRGGHGSPSNDVRVGSVPYVKVSDIRSLRVNVNPTNMVPLKLAQQKFWRGKTSRLHAWDLITPNRASSNIGEFAVLLPGEEEVVLTKEMFIISITEQGRKIIDPFYLLWALSLKAVRDQWRRIALMQTNREDVGSRHREIRLPWPPNEVDPKTWAADRSRDFKAYFEGISQAKNAFITALQSANEQFIGSVFRNAEDNPAELEEPVDNNMAIEIDP